MQINIASLSPAAQTNLLAAYYNASGIQYTLGRVPIAGCDFSTRVYTYDDVPNDFDLTHFALADEDTQYKVHACLFLRLPMVYRPDAA